MVMSDDNNMSPAGSLRIMIFYFLLQIFIEDKFIIGPFIQVEQPPQLKEFLQCKLFQMVLQLVEPDILYTHVCCNDRLGNVNKYLIE